MDKIYCFIYKIDEDKVYRQENECEKLDGAACVIKEDELINIISNKFIDTPIPNLKDSCIYFNSYTDDINYAMDKIYEILEKEINDLKIKVNYFDNLLSVFIKKKEYIKNKYPDGKK